MILGVDVPERWTVPRGVRFVRELRAQNVLPNRIMPVVLPLIPERHRGEWTEKVNKARAYVLELETPLVNAWNAAIQSGDPARMNEAMQAWGAAINIVVDMFDLDLSELDPSIQAAIEGLKSLARYCLAQLSFDLADAQIIPLLDVPVKEETAQ